RRCRRADRRRGHPAGRHAVRVGRRAAGRPAGLGRVRHDADREASDLRARPRRRALRSAGRAKDRAAGRGRGLPVLGARERRRPLGAVSDEESCVVMMIFRKALPRRTVLKGIGASVALPLLDAMVPALAAVPAPARRLGFVYLANGVAMNFSGINYWTPRGEGRNFPMSPILRPLEPFRDRLTVVSGLAHHQADAHDDGANGDHTRATSSWLTGVHCKRTEGADVENGVSADQIAARTIGRETPLPSLELGIDLNFLSGQCENSYSCVYLNTLAWSSPTTPLPTENNPRLVFERLFGHGGTNEQRMALARENRSILDSVREDFTRLSAK